jgi:hypothetical protein
MPVDPQRQQLLVESGLDYEVAQMLANGTTVVGTGTGVTSFVAAAGLGTTPPAIVVRADSGDGRGHITFGSGTSPATGALITVTFATPYTGAGNGYLPVIMIEETTAVTKLLYIHCINQSLTGFTIACQSAPSASQANTTYGLDYLVVA